MPLDSEILEKEKAMMHKTGRCSAPFQRRSGKRVTYYYYAYDENGKRFRRSTGMRSRSAAMEVIQDRIRTGTLLTDLLKTAACGSSMLFSDLAKDIFIPGSCPLENDKVLRGRPYTARVMKENRQRLDRYILPFFGKMKLCDINVRAVKNWQSWLVSHDLSNATANRVRTTAIPIFDYAVECGLMNDNPLKKVKPLYVSAVSTRQAFTEEEIRKLFSVPWLSSLARLACLLSACTGMRLGEVRALRGMDIQQGAIVISHSIAGDGSLKSTKSGRVRICPLPGFILDEIRAFIRDDDDFIFTTNGTRPVSGTYVNGYLEKAMADAGITREGLTFHSFRHFFNSQLVASGVQGELVRAVIGHESEAMTERYLHLQASQMKPIMQVQEAIGRMI